MATDLIRYDLLVQDALKGVVKRVVQNGRSTFFCEGCQS